MQLSVEEILKDFEKCTYCYSTEDVRIVSMPNKDRVGKEIGNSVFSICKDCRENLIRKLKE